jgi:hypothetical protein
MQPRTYKFVGEDALLNVPVPQSTDTYIAVSNELALTSVRAGIQNLGLTIKGEEYKLGKTGNVATGRIFIGDPESGLQRCMGWINSYDRSKRFGLACGGNVTICTNGMFTSDLVMLRKHTGSIKEELNAMISKALRYLEISFQNAVDAKTYFEHVNLTSSAVNEIIGQLYLENELIKNYQLSIIKDGLEKDTKFNMRDTPSMWNLYNIITESFKRSHVSTFVTDHIDLHKYMMGKVKEWELTGMPIPRSLIEDAIIVPAAALPIAAPAEIFIPEPVLETVMEADIPELEF